MLTSNGTTWISQAASGGQLQTEIFTAPGTWTKPASATQVRVTVVGGGQAGTPSTGGTIGNGGYAKAIVPVSAPVSITVGSAGTSPGGSGGTSSFGPAVSCTGGGGGAGGTGTVSVGTALRTYTSTSNVVFPTIDSFFSGDAISPQQTPTAGTGAAYSITGRFAAGAQGAFSAPLSPGGKGGIGGAIVVEFIG